MQIFSINSGENIPFAYLFYYDKEQRFFIEILDNSDQWEVTPILSSFVERGQRTINYYWSLRWVQNRIVPTDRQNIGQILIDSKLKSYDECKLLVISKGKCAQDDCYIDKIDKEDLPEEIILRHSKKVKNFIPMSDGSYLVFFCDNITKLCNISELVDPNSKLKLYLNAYPQKISKAKLLTDGFGIYWDDNMQILYDRLYNTGISVPIKYDDIMKFASDQVIGSSEVSKLLNCTRQYVNELTQKGTLVPLKKDSNNTLFYKDDVLRMRWK